MGLLVYKVKMKQVSLRSSTLSGQYLPTAAPYALKYHPDDEQTAR
jgi:hypothetical protein